jgi:O-antigen/teichoic acid export membrane protein
MIHPKTAAYKAGRRILLANVLSGAGAQGQTAIAALWSIPQLLAAVGPAGYGTYSLAATLLGYFSIADLGLSNATLQRLARARASADAAAFGMVFGTSLVLLSAIGALVGGLLALLAVPIGDLLSGAQASESQRLVAVSATRWCAAGALPALVRPALDAVVSASEQLTRSYAVATFANLTRTAGAVFAVWMWPGPLTPVIVLVAATTVQFVLLIPIAALSAPDVRPRHIRAGFAEMRSLLHVSVPLWLSSGAGLLANQVDRFVVSGWFGLAALGRYAVAQDLATRLWVLPYILSKAYFPRLARELAHDEPERHERTIRTYGAASLFASTVLGVPLAVCASSVLANWTARNDLGDAPAVFAWLLLGVIANCSSFAAFAVLQVRLRLRAIAVSYVLFLLLHILGCSTLPRVYGPTGAAISWAISQVVTATLLHAYLRRLCRVRLVSDTLRLLSAGACVAIGMTLAIHSFPLPSIGTSASALVRLAPVLATIGGWCAVGAVAALAFLVVGRKESGCSLLGAARRL